MFFFLIFIRLRLVVTVDANRELVINLFLKHFRPCTILTKLKPPGINEKLIFRTIKRYRETDSWKITPSSGCKRTVRWPEAIKWLRVSQPAIWPNIREWRTQRSGVFRKTTLFRIHTKNNGCMAWLKSRRLQESEAVRALVDWWIQCFMQNPQGMVNHGF